MKILLPFLCFLLTALAVRSQTHCTAPGQNPATAFPVCGTGVFAQSSVPICGGTQVPSPTCHTYPLTDVNPFWYKFTCFQSGTLGFRITPNTNSEDYDWQLFDVTNHDVNEVYTNANLVVACNWSGEGGTTGASSAGAQVFVCEGLGRPLWSKMPDIIQGHDYLLLISHFTQTQAGYGLSFGGGTAVITDSTMPHLKAVEASCGGQLLRVKLNKKMKCSSIAADGSDFFVTPGNPGITGISAIGCDTGFDTDSIEIRFNSAFAPGAYDLHIRNGADGNTILDYCDKPVPDTDHLPFNITGLLLPTPMDSMLPPSCKMQSIRLIFSTPILCSSVAGDGSDFTLTGPYPVSVTGAQANCGGTPALTKEIDLILSQPLVTAGNFTLTLKRGSDGNTLLDECTLETPAGSSLSFAVKDTVNAAFSFEKKYGCTRDTVFFSHPGANGVNQWQWTLGEGMTSNLQAPTAIYQVFDTKTIGLMVSNGFCKDSSFQTVALTNGLKADFTVYDDICPNEQTAFTSNAEGIRLRYNWNFGDGGTSADANPTHIYAAPTRTISYAVSCTVTDSIGCQKTATHAIKVYSSCYLDVPSAFTPNNDGLNDFLYPLNAVKALDLEFRVYNRWGQLLFRTNDWKHGWDGSFKGQPQPSGVYVWFLRYKERNTNKVYELKGTAALIR